MTKPAVNLPKSSKSVSFAPLATMFTVSRWLKEEEQEWSLVSNEESLAWLEAKADGLVREEDPLDEDPVFDENWDTVIMPDKKRPSAHGHSTISVSWQYRPQEEPTMLRVLQLQWVRLMDTLLWLLYTPPMLAKEQEDQSHLPDGAVIESFKAESPSDVLELPLSLVQSPAPHGVQDLVKDSGWPGGELYKKLAVISLVVWLGVLKKWELDDQHETGPGLHEIDMIPAIPLPHLSILVPLLVTGLGVSAPLEHNDSEEPAGGGNIAAPCQDSS